MLHSNLCYEASAGSGKTFMLVVRYLSLLFKGADPSKILALTFTNKAATEMSERVVETLEGLEHRGELAEIVKVTELSKEEILEARSRVLAEFLNAHTKIMTIDSFFTHVLRKFSLYASLMPDFSTFSSQHEVKLLTRFLKEVSVAGESQRLVHLALNSKKRISDIFTLLDEFYVKKEELSSLTFTQSQTQVYEQEAMSSLRALQEIVANCSSASESLKKAVIAESFEELKSKSWITKESLDYWVFKKCFNEEMNTHLHTIQNALVLYFRAKESNFFYALSGLTKIYQKSKKALYIEDSELSFNDVTSLVYEILHLLKDSEFLYFRLDATIEHMLLDEFQDTSILQYEILKPLIWEITSGEGVFSNGSFFFVGDVKQSIYRFRGGVSALFGEVAQENSTQREKLLTNYRSQKELVCFVNSIFDNKIKGYTPQLFRPEASGGYIEIITNDMLLEEVVTQVKRFISLGVDVDDIAILCATNGDGEEIQFALEHEGLEVVTETTTQLINQKSVKALLEYLKYLYFGERIYKENFFALLGRKSGVIPHIDVSRFSLIEIVKKAIEYFGLFFDEFHLIRFLDVVAKYKDIEALLFEYEREDATAAASDIRGVRVLTIHKSKGLEYEHVIVLDRLKKQPPARDVIIYEYDGIRLENIYLRTKDRDAIDSEYKKALAKEQELVREDTLNALYVAFTRARENLIVISKSEKSDFALLELEEGSFGELCIEKKEQIKSETYAPLSYKELYYGTQSEILGVERESAQELKALNFGTAMHYMLEMLESFSIESLVSAKDMMLNKYGFLLEDAEVEDIVHRVKLLIENKEFLSLIEGKCYKEKALHYKNSLRYIDLLVEEECGVWNIIDYKSSKSFADEHYKQVRAYVHAIQTITNQSAKGYLCYLLEKKVEIVPVT
ncbi:MAG: RecB-like helicase [Campylobacterales bacterium]|nr:RecB-like helicase [Campylobacterales bacterium]